ncbi:hypothetical protein GW17_00016220 [Ensete ventricosum]|nr:hypothetical protein GW17_00016220 [Ensete ventricosum]
MGAVAAADRRRCTPNTVRIIVRFLWDPSSPHADPTDSSTTRHHVIDRCRRAVEPKQQIPTVRTRPVTRGALDPPSFSFGLRDKRTRWFQEREAKGPMRIRTDRHIGAVGAD